VNSGKRYLIDTDVLVHIRKRKDSDRIYAALSKAAHEGWARTVKQVPDELERWKGAYPKVQPFKRKLIVPAKEQYCVAVRRMNDIVQDNAPFLFEPAGGKNPDPADPWLIAVAKVHGYTVVTNESPHSSVKIPAACKLPAINCPCINGAHFLLETKIVEGFELSQISAQAFFEGG
jgi:hypothetical protein